MPVNVVYRLDADTSLSSYLKNVSNDAFFEFAMHGYDHSQNEFGSITVENATNKLENGTAVIEKVVGRKPVTFIVPYNVYNNNTLEALKILNMTIISSGYDDVGRGIAFKEVEGIRHMPQTTDPFNWQTNSFFTFEEIIGSCKSALNTYDACVITVHAQTFSTDGMVDPEKLSLLTAVIDWAKGEEVAGNVTLATFHDI